MNRLVIFLTLCVVATVASAQQNIMVQYNQSTVSLKNDSLVSTQMILHSSPEKSLYYNNMSLYVDSLTSTPGGKERLYEIQMAAWKVESPDGGFALDMRRPAPRKTVNLYVSKDFSTSTLALYNKFGQDEAWYSEPFDELVWVMVPDSTATVLDYECFMATADYHGRRWTAWFAPEIPVQDGPWKLRGLPGLILKAVADNGASFTASGIETTDAPVREMYNADKYSKTSRKNALADEEHYRNNSTSILAAQGVKVTNKDGSAYVPPKFDRQIHALETDY